MNKRILFISHFDFITDTNTGGQKLAKSHYEIFCQIFGQNNVFCAILSEKEIFEDKIRSIPHTRSRRATFLNSLHGYIRGYSKKAEECVLEYAKQINPDLIFVDFSCYGSTIKKLKCNLPKIKIIAFFHDVESNYEINRVRKDSKFYYFSYRSALKQEKLTVKEANKIIALNVRDDYGIQKIYHRKADLLMPICLEDKFEQKQGIINDKYLLFVGSLFGPNIDGIKWYVENVAQFLKYKTYVVGKGFENFRDELETENVRIIGKVDDISEYYYSSQAVVMPILYGDGMKVKTAEALMFGKTVIGTNEAFEGYDIVDGIHGYCVNTAQGFIECINSKILKRYNEDSRKLFIKNYSLSRNKELLSELILKIMT